MPIYITYIFQNRVAFFLTSHDGLGKRIGDRCETHCPTWYHEQAAVIVKKTEALYDAREARYVEATYIDSLDGDLEYHKNKLQQLNWN